jgi:pimeloyl-ACP methyl ester carboxylesterase
MKTSTHLPLSFRAVLLLKAALLFAWMGTPFTAYSQKTPATPAREEFIEVEKNVRLHVTDLGEGPPVVLIHGWPLSDAMYEYQYAELVGKGYRVIGITLRGFGQSSKPYGAYNYDVFADDIKVVLGKLNIQNATLGGFSMGGATVIHYVAKHNAAHVNKLALFGAAAPVWTKRADFNYGIWSKADVDGLIALNNTNRAQLLENFGKIFAAGETSLSPGLAYWLGTINWQASPYAMAQCLATLRDTDLRPDLKKIKIPTLILHGKGDKICAFELAEQMNKLVEHSVLVPLEKSGHALFIEEREKFNQALMDFMEAKAVVHRN